MNTDDLAAQLQDLLAAYETMGRRAQHNDLSDIPKPERQALVTRSIAAIHRISGASSSYSEEVKRTLQTYPHLHTHTSAIMGVVKALKDDVEAGYVQTLIELAHGDVFADFLEMAEHLCAAGYKDAAAVVAGAALESHLRRLAIKNGIDTEVPNSSGAARPKKADRLNSDIAAANAYSKLDQKSVTAWLDLRNKAAHGEYDKYAPGQVDLLISGIRDFLLRHPA